jgi:hypothetical protein
MGLRKFCVDGSRCGLGMSCENHQTRDQTVDVGSYWTGRQVAGECDNFIPRTELNGIADMPRRKPGEGKHNKLRRSNLILPPHLQQAPDPMVTRHIKDGRDINKDKDD